MTSSNFSNLCHNFKLRQIPKQILLEPQTVETSAHPNESKSETEVGWGKGTYQKGQGLFCFFPYCTLSKKPISASTKQNIRKPFMNGTQGKTLFLKLVSFLKLPVYPLQIPKPPSVKLTNEAIKFKVLNSFELHLLSESFNNSTVDSQSSSGLFSTLVPFKPGPPARSFLCHSFPEGV